jgi:hypothetical protein
MAARERSPAASRPFADRTSAEDAHRGPGARRRAGRRSRKPTLARLRSAWRSQPPTPAVHAPPQQGRVEATGSRVARSPRWRARREAAHAQVGRQDNPLPLNPPRCPRQQTDFPRAVDAGRSVEAREAGRRSRPGTRSPPAGGTSRAACTRPGASSSGPVACRRRQLNGQQRPAGARARLPRRADQRRAAAARLRCRTRRG